MGWVPLSLGWLLALVCFVCTYSASAAMPLVDGLCCSKTAFVCGLCGLIASVGTSTPVPAAQCAPVCSRFCYSQVQRLVLQCGCDNR